MQFSYFREWKYSMTIRKKKIRSILKVPDKCWVLLRSAWMEAQCFCLSSVTVLHVCLQNDVAALLKPISEKIQEIQTFRERNRGSTMFNHLSAVSESIPALGWIAVVSLAGMSPCASASFWSVWENSWPPPASFILHPSVKGRFLSGWTQQLFLTPTWSSGLCVLRCRKRFTDPYRTKFASSFPVDISIASLLL